MTVKMFEFRGRGRGGLLKQTNALSLNSKTQQGVGYVNWLPAFCPQQCSQKAGTRAKPRESPTGFASMSEFEQTKNNALELFSLASTEIKFVPICVFVLTHNVSKLADIVNAQHSSWDHHPHILSSPGS